MAQVLTKDGEIVDEDDDTHLRTIQILIDLGGQVASVNGAFDVWLGLNKEEIVGSVITALIQEDSVVLVTEILYKAALQEKMDPMTLFLNGPQRSVLGAQVEGRPFPRDPDYFHLTFIIDPALEFSSKSRNTPKGLVSAVQRSMAQHEGKDLDLTFVDVGDVDRLRDQYGVSEEKIDDFRQQVEQRLQESSVDKNSVSQVVSGKFGMVNEQGSNLESLKSDLQAYADSIDPEKAVLSVGTKTVLLDGDNLSEDEIETAITHAVDEFVDAGLDSIIFDTLETSQASYLDRRADRRAVLVSALDQNRLTIAFSPIVDVQHWQADHFLSEFRADLDDDGLGAMEIASLADSDTDLRIRVDTAQCHALLSDKKHGDAGVEIRIAIRSLLDVTLLSTLMEQARTLSGDFILRIEGLNLEALARITALSTVRNAGFKVALLGKEIGAVSEERLKTLPADFIVLDPSLVSDADGLARSLPALDGLAERCLQNGIKVVFDGVMNADVAKILTSVPGVQAAGPYYGDPVDEISQSPVPRKS